MYMKVVLTLPINYTDKAFCKVEVGSIAGKSLHVERVEWLWRDVTRCISSNCIQVFSELEEEDMLDPGLVMRFIFFAYTMFCCHE